MATHPLPKTFRRLLIASLILGSASMLVAIIHIAVFKLLDAPIGAYSLLVIPIVWLFTTLHHSTLFVLSKRTHGPPPIPTSPVLALGGGQGANASRSSVYRPATGNSHTSTRSGTGVGFLNDEGYQPTAGGQHGQQLGRGELGGEIYPSYVISNLNIIAVVALALIWSFGAWSPIVTAVALSRGRYKLHTHHGAEIALSILESVFGYAEIVVLWLVASFVTRARWPQFQRPRREFIRMEG